MTTQQTGNPPHIGRPHTVERITDGLSQVLLWVDEQWIEDTARFGAPDQTEAYELIANLFQIETDLLTTKAGPLGFVKLRMLDGSSFLVTISAFDAPAES